MTKTHIPGNLMYQIGIFLLEILSHNAMKKHMIDIKTHLLNKNAIFRFLAAFFRLSLVVSLFRERSQGKYELQGQLLVNFKPAARGPSPSYQSCLDEEESMGPMIRHLRITHGGMCMSAVRARPAASIRTNS
jgi:hypothetical protein